MKPKVRNFSITYTGEAEEMTNYIIEKLGVTSRSQVYNVALRQYYLALKADEEAKAKA